VNLRVAMAISGGKKTGETLAGGLATGRQAFCCAPAPGLKNFDLLCGLVAALVRPLSFPSDPGDDFEPGHSFGLTLRSRAELFHEFS
jgi:hypothetical protein